MQIRPAETENPGPATGPVGTTAARGKHGSRCDNGYLKLGNTLEPAFAGVIATGFGAAVPSGLVDLKVVSRTGVKPPLEEQEVQCPESVMPHGRAGVRGRSSPDSSKSSGSSEGYDPVTCPMVAPARVLLEERRPGSAVKVRSRHFAGS
ncbi:hypothetical protein AAFF_G00093520 [Aldrovandia affinis]|uniref:Uncharacterized protein n=1 Tax=Aldrovandia affinis TaxID=143900 RepID=A0AAD7T2W0_9TELE|nr:hypothetical protein AAFF_G00093520 [Aldrovandia affinis]